jgi:PAB-dependent poly(A)-specific ribonuclease subunit 2
MATLTSAEFGLYGPNTGRLLPNQVVKSRQILAPSNPGIQAPKFLSEKARESAKASASSVAFGDETSVDQESFANSGFDNSKSDIPAKYRNVEIKYSRFGVDDFDFRCVCMAFYLMV